jgi:hypothetical protein
MKEVAELLNAMRAGGVISDYALFGAVAQMRYTEPVATLDADVLIDLPPHAGLDVLAPIYEFCAAKGGPAEGEAVRVGAWPVRFIPAFGGLTGDALAHADAVDFEGVPLRVVRADYLAVIALSVGRATDLTRIVALLEAGNVTPEGLGLLAGRYGLSDAWQRFKTRFLDA